MLIGGTAGAVSQFIASPFDLLKVQYITGGSANRSLISTAREIVNKNGMLGLWKGVTPNVSRAILVNLGELSTYDHAKQFIKRKLNMAEGTPLHVLSSTCSGFVAAICCTPADVVKSRLM